MIKIEKVWKFLMKSIRKYINNLSSLKLFISTRGEANDLYQTDFAQKQQNFCAFEKQIPLTKYTLISDSSSVCYLQFLKLYQLVYKLKRNTCM